MKETISKQRHTSMMFFLPQEFLNCILFVIFASTAMTNDNDRSGTLAQVSSNSGSSITCLSQEVTLLGSARIKLRALPDTYALPEQYYFDTDCSI